MESNAHQKQIIDLHLEMELLMADLYVQFANVFKEHQDFLLSLASEEKQHVAWLNMLIEGINANEVKFDEGISRMATLASLLNYLHNIKQEFEAKPFSIVRAVSLMRDFEKSLLEKNVFDNFDGDSTQVKEIIAKLANAQLTHIKNIETGAEKILWQHFKN